MTKAEELFKKHLKDYDTTSYIQEDSDLKQCYLNALNEALSIHVVTQCEAVEPTNKTEEIQVCINKKLLVELYDFAYEQAVKTNTVAKLHDIDRRLHGG